MNLNQTCPHGFNISELATSCVCEPRLAHYTNQCNITNGLGQITRDTNQYFWVGNSSQELILHPHCPFYYCVNQRVVFPLNNTDLQCAYNRSGLLCRCCQAGYSLVLGVISTHDVRRHLSLLAHPFCSDGSSTGVLAPCLQTDSGNRNTQWPSALSQYHWCQSYHLSTSEIYQCVFSLHCMD